jgi:transcriptional regulator with XRE-family HTH domain
MKNSVDINAKLRKLREELKISAKSLGIRTGYSLNSVQRYEKEMDPPFRYLLKLVEIFEIRSNYFFDPDDELIFKRDEKVDPEIVQSVREVGVELGYLRSEVAEIKEWKRKIEKEKGHEKA